jgi:hypothetical protein
MAATSINGRLHSRGKLIVGCPLVESGVYSATTGIDVSANDYGIDDMMHGIRLDAGAGNIAFEFENGGTMTLAFAVDSGKNEEFLRGYRIKKILKAASGTTYSGHIFPLF